MSDSLRIGLLQCGNVEPVLQPTFGDYPVLYADLLAGHDLDLVTYDVQHHGPPADPRACDGWLISGSAHSAYAPLGWIAPTEAFVRRVIDAAVPLVGICFGHQLLAQAMGGKVEHCAAGWGVGAHDYHLVGEARTPGWPAASPLRLLASHQDQVTVLPDGADVIARTDHCPIAGYLLGPRALAIQPHPEFSTDLSRELTTVRRHRIGDRDTDAALASLDLPIDNSVVAAWMAAFWQSA